MAEMSPELLEALRRGVSDVDRSLADIRSSHAVQGWGQAVSNGQVRAHANRQEAQRALRAAMAIWAGPYHQAGYSEDRLQRTFWHLYGVSVLEAQALHTKDAEALLRKLQEHRYAI